MKFYRVKYVIYFLFCPLSKFPVSVLTPFLPQYDIEYSKEMAFVLFRLLVGKTSKNVFPFVIRITFLTSEFYLKYSQFDNYIYDQRNKPYILYNAKTEA